MKEYAEEKRKGNGSKQTSDALLVMQSLCCQEKGYGLGAPLACTQWKIDEVPGSI